MNLAFSAVVIFLYVLPGIIVRRSGSLAGRFRRERQVAEEVAESFLWAAIIHGVALPVCWMLSPVSGVTPDLSAALALAAGGYHDDGGKSLSAVTEYPFSVLLYFLSVWLLGYLAGCGLWRLGAFVRGVTVPPVCLLTQGL